MIEDPLFQLCLIFAVVIYYNGLRNNYKLTRSALLQPNQSPWNQLLNFGDNNSFITITGLNRYAFMQLEAVLLHNLPPPLGRTPSLNFRGQLGLYLLFLGSRMSLKHLCMLFGIVPSSASVFIRRMMKLICRKLKHDNRAAVRFPSQDEMPALAAMVQSREPRVNNVIGFLDGLAIPVQCSSDPVEQAAYYSGYHFDTTVNNTFLFLPTGKIAFACINYPGSWHDTQVCADLIAVVLEHIGWYAICVDQGFPRSGPLFERFVGPLSRRMRRRLAPALRILLVLHAVYISLRQASEWGMRAIQGTFCRIKSRLTSDKEIRRKILLSVVLPQNFRTEIMGINQIAAVFNPHYEQFVNLDGYDRIARYFM